MLGAPTGLSVKHWLSSNTAFDLGLGVGPGVRLHGDYLLELARPVRGPDASLGLYLGGGVLVGGGTWYCGYYAHGGNSCGNFYAGVRVPLGMDVPLHKAPVAFGLELAPGIVGGTDGVGGIFDVMLWIRFVLG